MDAIVPHDVAPPRFPAEATQGIDKVLVLSW